MNHDKFYTSLFRNNKKWGADISHEDNRPLHAPAVLWIGCSDNNAQDRQLADKQNGEVIVHNSVANMVLATDTNLLSVVDYAVNVLKVKYIVVAGHYGCSGIKNAVDNSTVTDLENRSGIINNTYKNNIDELEAIENNLLNGLVELNVREQVYNLALTAVVQNAWDNGQELCLNGCVYTADCNDINDLDMNISGNDDLDKISRLLIA